MGDRSVRFRPRPVEALQPLIEESALDFARRDAGFPAPRYPLRHFSQTGAAPNVQGQYPAFRRMLLPQLLRLARYKGAAHTAHRRLSPIMDDGRSVSRPVYS